MHEDQEISPPPSSPNYLKANPSENRRYSIFITGEFSYFPTERVGKGADSIARTLSCGSKVVLSPVDVNDIDWDEVDRKKLYYQRMHYDEVQFFEFTKDGKRVDYRFIVPYFKGQTLDDWNRCSLAHFSVDSFVNYQQQTPNLFDEYPVYMLVATTLFYFKFDPVRKRLQRKELVKLPIEEKALERFPALDTYENLDYEARRDMYYLTNRKHLHKVRASYIEQLRICFSLVEKIDRCRSKGLVYVDLKPTNSIIGSDLNIQLVDGGHVFEIDTPLSEKVFYCRNERKRDKKRRSFPHIAPECFYIGSKPPLAKTAMDIYSFFFTIRLLLDKMQTPLNTLLYLLRDCASLSFEIRPNIYVVEERLQLLAFIMDPFSGELPALFDHREHFTSPRMLQRQEGYIIKEVRKFLDNPHWKNALKELLHFQNDEDKEAFLLKIWKALQQVTSLYLESLSPYACKINLITHVLDAMFDKANSSLPENDYKIPHMVSLLFALERELKPYVNHLLLKNGKEMEQEALESFRIVAADELGKTRKLIQNDAHWDAYLGQVQDTLCQQVPLKIYKLEGYSPTMFQAGSVHDAALVAKQVVLGV